jgi:hypothetical protein
VTEKQPGENVSLNYELLGKPEAEHIRRQRLLDLEADHYRFVLDLEELPTEAESGQLLAKLSDVERRIVLHRQALGLPLTVTAPDDEPVPEHSGSETS